MEFQIVPAAEIKIDPLDVGADSKLNLVDVIDRRRERRTAPASSRSSPATRSTRIRRRRCGVLHDRG